MVIPLDSFIWTYCKDRNGTNLRFVLALSRFGALNCKKYSRLCKRYMLSDHVAVFVRAGHGAATAGFPPGAGREDLLKQQTTLVASSETAASNRGVTW